MHICQCYVSTCIFDYVLNFITWKRMQVKDRFRASSFESWFATFTKTKSGRSANGNANVETVSDDSWWFFSKDLAMFDELPKELGISIMIVQFQTSGTVDLSYIIRPLNHVLGTTSKFYCELSWTVTTPQILVFCFKTN